MATIARQQPLPGTEDAAIQTIEDKAIELAEVRSERISLSQQEGELKKDLLDLMKKHKKTHYEHGNITIDVVVEKENVKVKVAAAGGEGDDEDEE